MNVLIEHECEGLVGSTTLQFSDKGALNALTTSGGVDGLKRLYGSLGLNVLKVSLLEVVEVAL